MGQLRVLGARSIIWPPRRRRRRRRLAGHEPNGKGGAAAALSRRPPLSPAAAAAAGQSLSILHQQRFFTANSRSAAPLINARSLPRRRYAKP